MAYSVSAGRAAGRAVVPYSVGPTFSTNVPFKKHISQLEIVSEEDDEADDGESFCTSPMCGTKESSSDEGSKMLLQQLQSSESPLWFDKEAKHKHYATLQVEREMYLATEVSSTQVHKDWQSSTMVRKDWQSSTMMVPASSGNSKARPSMATYAPEAGTGKGIDSRTVADLQTAKCDQCYCLIASKTVNLLRRSFASIPRLWKKSVVVEDNGDISQCSHPSSNVDDVNEMKALLNTINQNLKLLETRCRAHPQFLSTKLAPVYFTT